MQKCVAAWRAAIGCGLVALGCGSPTAPDPPTPVPPSRLENEHAAAPGAILGINNILAFGDSITEGFVSPAPSVLQLRSMAAGTNAVAVNLDAVLSSGSIGKDRFHPTRAGYQKMA